MYKVLGTFTDKENPNKTYQIGETFQSQDKERIQNLINQGLIEKQMNVHATENQAQQAEQQAQQAEQQAEQARVQAQQAKANEQQAKARQEQQAEQQATTKVTKARGKANKEGE